MGVVPVRDAVADVVAGQRDSMDHGVLQLPGVEQTRLVAAVGEATDRRMAAADGLRGWAIGAGGGQSQHQIRAELWEHGIDGGKKVKGVKLHILVDKFGLPVEMTVSAANVGDRDGLREMLVVVHEEMPTVRDVLGDLSYSGEEIRYEARLAGVSLKTKRCGDKKSGFVPTEVRWVVERTFGWFAQWRRIAVAYERNVSHFVDFAWIAIASIVAARLRAV